jgi:hypothetical protein
VVDSSHGSPAAMRWHVGLRSYVYDSRDSYFRLAGFNFGRSIAHSLAGTPVNSVLARAKLMHLSLE